MASYAINSTPLREALGAILHAAARGPDRPILAGIKIERRPVGLRLVAADNYRLAFADLPQTEIEVQGEPAAVVLPIDAMERLYRELRTVRNGPQVIITFDESHEGQVSIGFAGTTRVVIPIDGRYPDYEQIVPAGPPFYRIGLGAAYLAEAAKAFGAKPSRYSSGLTGVVQLELQKSPNAPIVMRSHDLPNVTEVIMPVRIVDGGVVAEGEKIGEAA